THPEVARGQKQSEAHPPTEVGRAEAARRKNNENVRQKGCRRLQAPASQKTLGPPESRSAHSRGQKVGVRRIGPDDLGHSPDLSADAEGLALPDVDHGAGAPLLGASDLRDGQPAVVDPEVATADRPSVEPVVAPVRDLLLRTHFVNHRLFIPIPVAANGKHSHRNADSRITPAPRPLDPSYSEWSDKSNARPGPKSWTAHVSQWRTIASASTLVALEFSGEGLDR